MASGAKKLSSNMAWASSGGAFQAGAYRPMPALLIRISILPNRWIVRSTTRLRTDASVISPAVTAASASATSFNLSSERAVSDSRAPRLLNSRAQAAAIPCEAPVIKTTLPSIFIRLQNRDREGADSFPKRNNSNMQSKLLPLFPLQVVVFPRTQLPLHIFEDRYKEMVGEAIRDKSEFGIVLTKEDGILNAGCTVVVDKILKSHPDGRMDILTRGIRRFEIVMLNQEKPYLRGEVSYFDDDEPGPADNEVQIEALRLYKSWMEIQDKTNEVELGDTQLSFQLAQGIEDLDFLHFLLRSRSEPIRLKKLTEFLSDYVPRQRQTAIMRKLAPLNGH